MFGPFGIDFAWSAELGMAPLAISQYSPLALRHLPQPRPSDAPNNTDASIFTFEDAFEDLLAVSQGQQLPSILTKLEQRKLLRYMYPDGEPAYVWLRRLQSQSLLGVPSSDQLATIVDTNWEKFHRELDRRATAVWQAAMGESQREASDQLPHGPHGENVDDGGYTGHNPLLDDSEQRQSQRRQPDHFEDLFSSMESSFTNAQTTWDSFVKSITDGPSSSPPEIVSANRHAGEEKQIVERDEHVDCFGYLHSKVTVKTIDENGNQIGSQTNYTVRPVDQDKHAAKDQNQEAKTGFGFDGKGRVEAKTSWIWK